MSQRPFVIRVEVRQVEEPVDVRDFSHDFSDEKAAAAYNAYVELNKKFAWMCATLAAFVVVLSIVLGNSHVLFWLLPVALVLYAGCEFSLWKHCSSKGHYFE